MHGAAYGRLCVAPSRITQKIFAVLVEWYHRIVLTMRFKLVSFFTFISYISRVIADFVPNFVAMATGVIRGQI